MSSAEIHGMGLPQLHSVQKAMELPTVNAAVTHAHQVYSSVKNYHSLFNWALSTAEQTLALAAHTATPLAPLVAAPLAAADLRVLAALQGLEQRAPIVTQTPAVILDTTKSAISAKVAPHINKMRAVLNPAADARLIKQDQVCAARQSAQRSVASLKQLSWTRCDQVLRSTPGQVALATLDTGAGLAYALLDRYLPEAAPLATATPTPASRSEGIPSVAEDPTMHTIRTVSQLSQVAAARIWSNVARHFRALQASGIDPKQYLATLLATLHLAALIDSQKRNDQNAQNLAHNAQAPEATSSQNAEASTQNAGPAQKANLSQTAQDQPQPQNGPAPSRYAQPKSQNAQSQKGQYNIN